jgi:hypothetical protein
MNIKLLTQPEAVRIYLLKRFSWMIPAKYYLEMLFHVRMGYKLNIKSPRTFNEKLQWLKLYDRKPEYPNMVDKFEVKEYVRGILGNEYIVPLLGVWEKPEDIEWGKLPNQFVLKTTHGGGSTGVVICPDKKSFDKEKAISVLNKSMKDNIWSELREWPYKNLHKRIIAEEYLTDQTNSVNGDLNDYKFYCFNGNVKYCEVITGRRTKKQIDFFDLNWNHMDFTFNGYDFADQRPQKPKCFDTMVEVAGKLCKDKPYSRIDLYVIGNKVYFGEITFYPASGFRGFHPDEWNIRLGDMITLPVKTNK